MRSQKSENPEIKTLRPETLRRIAAGVMAYFPNSGSASVGVVNHSPIAISLHAANHGQVASIMDVDPSAAIGPVALMFDSPPCSTYIDPERLARLRGRRRRPS